MTDHLDEAAAKAVELAASLTSRISDFPGDSAIAAHLTYLAGLIRGGAVRSPKVSTWTTADEQYQFPRQWLNEVVSGQAARAEPLTAKSTAEDAAKVGPLANRTSPAIDPRTAAANFRASAVKVGEGFGPHSNTWQAGLRHGYLMAADALDEVADEVEEARAQREELLAAAKQLLTDQSGDAWPRVELRETVARIEAE
jgi:hypothetical protein